MLLNRIYNLQQQDAKNNIPIDFEVTNKNNSRAMAPIVERATDILGHNQFKVLFDKGYHNGAGLQRCRELSVYAIVAPPNRSVASKPKYPDYDHSQFTYKPIKDAYTCPQNQTLISTGKWYKNQSGIRFKQYKSKACSVKELCTKAKYGRMIHRSKYEELYQINRKRATENHELYRKRQAIVEHPFIHLYSIF